tara:strand:- start:505 stop:1188 length:684 start_codon:yes stop_codon:yes gene_type:complete
MALNSGREGGGKNVNEPNKAMIISVGQRVRRERIAKGLRLSDLGRECGISVPTLSKFENGHISLNFRHLVEIARALTVPVSRFMSAPETVAVTGRRSFTRNGEGLRQETQRIDFEVLCDDLAHRHNVFWKARVKARTLEEYGEFSSHPGEEFILVLEGEILLHTLAYKPLHMGKGDSVHFDGMSPHAYIAVSKETPVILISNMVEDNLMTGAGEDVEEGDGPSDDVD